MRIQYEIRKEFKKCSIPGKNQRVNVTSSRLSMYDTSFEQDLRKYSRLRTKKMATKPRKIYKPMELKPVPVEDRPTKSKPSDTNDRKKGLRKRQVVIDKDIVTLMEQQDMDYTTEDNDSRKSEKDVDRDSMLSKRTFVMNKQSQPNVMYIECLAKELENERNDKVIDDDEEGMDAIELVKKILGKTDGTETSIMGNLHTTEYNIKR